MIYRIIRDRTSTSPENEYLGADQLSQVHPENRAPCLFADVARAGACRFYKKKFAHQVCSEMNEGAFAGRFVVVRVPR